MEEWVILMGFISQNGFPAMHARRRGDNRKMTNHLPDLIVKPFARLPETSPIELISKRDYAHDTRCVVPMCRELMSNPDDTNVLAVIIFLTARLSELPSPERLAHVDLRTKMRKHMNNGFHVIYGDNQVVTVDAHLTNKGSYLCWIK